jgi:hypothetical protein
MFTVCNLVICDTGQSPNFTATADKNDIASYRNAQAFVGNKQDILHPKMHERNPR